jgi:uncharacterized zinc-type alcohol dehydrogenase-like protein
MESSGSFESKAMACKDGKAIFEATTIRRRAVGDNDIHIKTKFAGICHSDIHTAREEWGPAIYPLVPGHEVAGVVEAVGKNVTKFKVGDHAGVGCFVDSCRDCDKCKTADQNYCRKGMVGTYNSRFKYPHCPGYNEDPTKCEPTYGGYSQDFVIDQDYAINLPKNLPLERTAPLMCAGITVYSPMKYYGVKAGDKIAVAGLGGLGSMAVKFGVAMGAHVTVLSRGTKKRDEALKVLGAHDFVDVTDANAVKAKGESFSHIVDTISAQHDLNMYMGMLDIDGKIIVVGGVVEPFQVPSFSLLLRRKQVVGSLIGGIRETQEMIDFCGQKDISCEVEVIKPDYINKAYDRTVAADVKYRFSIDMTQM